MATLHLALAILFEAGWAVAMKASGGMTRLGPTLAMLACFILSAVFLALATKVYEVGVAYAIWVGSGAAIIAAVGIFYFKEPASPLKLASLGLVLAGVVGLKLASRPAPAPTQAPAALP